VEEHSGTIEIRNLQPAGAEIALLLPALREQKAAQLADANANAG